VAAHITLKCFCLPSYVFSGFQTYFVTFPFSHHWHLAMMSKMAVRSAYSSLSTHIWVAMPLSLILQVPQCISKVSFDLKYLEKGLFAFKRPQRQLRQLRQYRWDFWKKKCQSRSTLNALKTNFLKNRTFKDFKRNDALLMHSTSWQWQACSLLALPTCPLCLCTMCAFKSLCFTCDLW